MLSRPLQSQPQGQEGRQRRKGTPRLGIRNVGRSGGSRCHCIVRLLRWPQSPRPASYRRTSARACRTFAGVINTSRPPALQRPEAYPALVQRRDGVDQMARGPAQPAQPPHHQGVAGQQRLDKHRQLRPGRPGYRSDVGPDLARRGFRTRVPDTSCSVSARLVRRLRNGRFRTRAHGGEIRTLERFAPLRGYQPGAFGHSATPPRKRGSRSRQRRHGERHRLTGRYRPVQSACSGAHAYCRRMSARGCCQGTRGTARRRSRLVPGDGHESCPVVATGSAHDWPPAVVGVRSRGSPPVRRGPGTGGRCHRWSGRGERGAGAGRRSRWPASWA
jgi:hypothetical protein